MLDKLDLSEIAHLLGRVDPASVPLLLDTADPRHLKVLTEHISTPGQLKRILDLSQGDDELVDRFLEKAGDDVILDRVFALMPTLLRLSCGILDGISAFLVGKAQINGDILFGAKLAVAFDLSQS